jgi:hypothetical protein
LSLRTELVEHYIEVVGEFMELVTAAALRIDTLYHYQAFVEEKVRPIVVDNRLYCSKPQAFNDPWDCRPCFDVAALDDPDIRERTIQFFERGDRRLNQLSEEEHRTRSRRLREDRGFLDWCVAEMRGIEAAINRQYRVYCLTPHPHTTLMWSHYARNHTGICLEFSVRSDVMCAALRVAYCDSYPSLTLAGEGLEHILPLLTKSADWSHESEFRLIAQERSEATSARTLMTDNSLLAFPRPMLRSVIIGCQMLAADRDVVRGMLRETGGTVALKQAVRIPNQYALRIEPLN